VGILRQPLLPNRGRGSSLVLTGLLCLTCAIVVAGCGKAKDPPPDIVKSLRVPLDKAQGVQKQMDDRVGELQRQEEKAMKDEAK